MSVFDDDDDDDRDDDRSQQPRQGRRRRDNRRQGEVDLSADPSFAWRFLGRIMSGFANDLGKKGYGLAPVQLSLQAIENVLGPQLTSMGINALAAAVQNPQIVKAWMKGMGWPDQVVALGDEFIDDVFEGVRMALRGDKINENDVNRAISQASQKLLSKAPGPRSFADAAQLLTATEFDTLDDLLKGFGPDDRKKFDGYRQQIASVSALRALIRRVAAVPAANRSAEALAYLQRQYGDSKAPALGVVANAVGGLTKRLGDGVKRLMDDPAASFTAMADAIDQGTQAAEPAAQARRDRLEELKARR